MPANVAASSSRLGSMSDPEKRVKRRMPEWLNVAGAICSMLGFGAALVAAWKATGAARAAEDARRAIRQQTLAEKLEQLRRRAEPLEAMMSRGETTSAAHFARDLYLEMCEIYARHGPRSPQDLRTALATAKRHAEVIHSALSSTVDLPVDELPRLRKKADDCVRALADALGYARAGMDHPRPEG